MPVFFFHVRDGEHLNEDTIGVDLPDLAAARREALWAIGDMMLDAALTGRALPGEAFEITDGGGQRVLTLPFDALLDRMRIGRERAMNATE